MIICVERKRYFLLHKDHSFSGWPSGRVEGTGYLKTEVLGTPHSMSIKDTQELEDYHGK